MARENRFKLRIKGQAQTIAAFKALDPVAKKHLGKATEDTAISALARMRANVRVNTGMTKRDLGYSFNAKSGKATTGIVKGSPRRSVAHLIEFGSKHSRPFPFVVPAVEAERGPYLERCREAGKRIEAEMAFNGEPTE